MITLDSKRLRESREGVWFVVDLLMQSLLVANLPLLLIGALYASEMGTL